MSQWGWGIAATAAVPDRIRPWWRWDHPDSHFYNLRPDRLVANLQSIREFIDASKGLGAPSRTTPTSTIPSKRRQGRASAEHGKHGGPRRESRRGGRARRKECPKGHYWSYKHKKCMKSKFR